MVVLDTNVISALMQAIPETKVVSWLDRQPVESIWVTAVNVFEIRFGIESLAKGKRQKGLRDSFEQLLLEDLGGRILNFDVPAAREAARIAARLRTGGTPVEIRDVEIAGIIAARHATLSTRHTRHFAGTGIKIVNPWQD